MKLLKRLVSLLFLLILSLSLSGCLHKRPVRHLASDVSLIILNQTSQKEILTIMGYPEKKKSIDESQEEWLFYQINKSFWRRTPLIGKKIGQADYDVAIIKFKDQNQLIKIWF